MTDDDKRAGNDIERFRGRSGRVQSRRGEGRGGRPARDAPRQDGSSTLAEEIARSTTGQPVSAQNDAISASLVGIPRVELEKLAYDHQLDGSRDAGETRPVALFDIENTGTRPLRWNASRTRFIGDDEYTYQPAHLSLDPKRLGPGCHTRQVRIEPGTRARMVTLVEQLPAGVEIAEVVHTLASGGLGSERLVFSIR